MEKKIKGNSGTITYKKLVDFLDFSKKCMCKIVIPSEKICGSGFFCKLNLKEFNDIQKIFLFTNNHVINEKYLDTNDKLLIEIDEKKKILNLDNRIWLTDKNNDFTIIEIKYYDKIYHYFEISQNILENDLEKEFEDKDIIIPQYPGGEELSIGFGSILKISQNIIHHSVSTDYGSSGSPIISQKDFKVIGIHNLRKNDLNENNGVFMKNIILSIQKKKEEKNIDMTYEYTLNISNLELIKTIENDINFKNIYY